MFLDIGGVVLTNGWDHLARRRAAKNFKLEWAEMEHRHNLNFATYEEGKLALGEYLSRVIFYRKRAFTRAQFKHFMFAQSKPYTAMIEMIVQLKIRYGLKIAVVSNEARELNAYRIRKFKLDRFVDAFVSSCFVHVRKPDADIFRLALDLTQARARQVVIETEAQDISAYIPTNLISITDGQIYLSPTLFELGVLPAVDVGKSVSRVGGQAQRAAYRGVAGDLKLAYAQFEELETFSRFGARLDENTRKTIEHGKRIRACLKQGEFAPVSVPAQIATLLGLNAGLFDHVALDQMKIAQEALVKAVDGIPAEVRNRLDSDDKLSDEDRKTINDIARQSLASFQPKPESKPEAKTEPKPRSGSKPAVQKDPKPKPKPEPGKTS